MEDEKTAIQTTFCYEVVPERRRDLRRLSAKIDAIKVLTSSSLGHKVGIKVNSGFNNFRIRLLQIMFIRRLNHYLELSKI